MRGTNFPPSRLPASTGPIATAIARCPVESRRRSAFASMMNATGSKA
jgi:hypothetical protein